MNQEQDIQELEIQEQAINQLLKIEREEDPQILSVKKKLKLLIVGWMLMKILNIVTGYSSGLQLVMPEVEIIVGLVMAIIYAIAIYKGIRSVAVLGLVGVIRNVLNIHVVIMFLSSDYVPFKVFSVVALITILYQLLFMLYILISPEMKNYSNKIRQKQSKYLT